MSTEWYLMGSNPVYNSGYEKEEFEMYAKDSFDEILETSPVSKRIQIIDHELTLISELNSVVLNNIADSVTKTKERQLLTTIGTLQCGDYVSYENKIWLITSFVGNNGVYEKAIMELCNFSIKFQSPDGVILSYPCITSNKTFSENPNQTVISLGENKKSILLPFDENTSELKVDDRMFIDRLNMTPFKIIGSVDNVTYSYGDKGLIYFIAEQDILITAGEHPDRTDLGVCDYFEPATTPPLPENKNCSIITYTGNPEIRIGGSTKTFTCTAYDEFDKIVEITPVWTITTLPEYETYIHKTETGNTIKIKADDVANMIQSKIKLEVSDVSGDYYSSIYITIVSGV